MTKQLKILTSAFFIALSLVLVSQKAQASEGTVELVSTTGTDTRCFASSVLMQNFQYKVIASCKNLVFPAQENKFAYLLWATPTEGGNSIKLGSLNLGKAEFNVKKPFSQLFVTTEINDKVRAPSTNSIVAQGTVKTIDHLDYGIEPEPTLGPAQDFGEIIERPTPTTFEQPLEEKEQGGILSNLGRGSLIAVIGIFFVLLFLAFITRSRG